MMYPVKNVFTKQVIGQFGYDNGQIKVEGDFPAREEIRSLAQNAYSLAGGFFEHGLRDSPVPLEPAKDIDRVANFVNANLSDHSIRIINYEEEAEDEDIKEEDVTEDAEMVVRQYVCKECDNHFKQVKGTPTCPKCRSQNVTPIKGPKKFGEGYKGFSKQEWEEGSFDADDALQKCVSTKIPIFKKEHPDWDMKHVEGAAYGYCRDKLGMKDIQWSQGGTGSEKHATYFLVKHLPIGTSEEEEKGFEEGNLSWDDFFTGDPEKVIAYHYTKPTNIERIKKQGIVPPVFAAGDKSGVFLVTENDLTEKIDVFMRKNYGSIRIKTEVPKELIEDDPTSKGYIVVPAVHPDWISEIEKTEDKVHVSAHTREGGKVDVQEHTRSLPAKDHAFALIKDNDFAGMGTVFEDGTIVFHTQELTELFGNLSKLQSIHPGEVQLVDIAAGVKETTHEEGHRVDYTENYRRERQFDPKDCEKDSFKTFEKNGKKLIGCKRKSTGKFEVQSVLSETKDEAFKPDCPRRKSLLEDSSLLGYTMPSGYFDHTGEITANHSLKGVTVADVILAKEMVQIYHRSELPEWLRDQPGLKDKEFVKVLKSYEELDKTFSLITEGPATQFHVEDSFPAMNSPVVLSAVKSIRVDPKCRCIKGKIYFVDKNWPQAVIESVKRGDITAVSIGGSTEFGPGGIFNGESYDLAQKNIKFGHLAVLPGAEGRCPRGLCGVNLKDAKNLSVGHTNEHQNEVVNGHFNTLKSAGMGFSQSIFAIPAKPSSIIDINGYDPMGHNLLNTEDVNIMAGNDEIVQKLQESIATKNEEIAGLRKELGNFKDSASAKKLKEMEDTHNAAKDQIAALVKENGTLKDGAAKLEERVKEADTFRHKLYDNALLGTPAYKGKEKDLAAMPLEKKAIIFEAAQQFGLVKLADAAILADGFPKPPEAQRQQLMDSGGRTRTKMPDPTIEIPKDGK